MRYDNICVYVSTETSPLLSAKAPLYLPFVFHALEKDTRIHNQKLSLLKVKHFGGVSDFLYSFHIDFITVSRTYIPFIQTKILTLLLENHYINS